ncbi:MULTISPECIES: hypothetical protein [Actinosynnema]|uniref:hypothetical protein n=1 Tax=Actinosynnema TaxID=40566 RepID=UPI0020A4E824|nr:hypothetical protein [Actinosynnema pretiosum]MCP2098664.1 hypothetical protein [Actinosynnema pretiosum]
MGYEAEAALLGRLAGRLSDEAVAMTWGDLNAGETGLAHAGLAGWLEVERVALTREEAALFTGATGRTPPLVADEPPPGYTFTARGGAEPPEHEERLLAWAARLPEVRQVLRAWRVPGRGATQPAAWVHLVVVDAGTPPHHVVFREPGVHAVAEGEELPPYLAAALAAAEPLRQAGG